MKENILSELNICDKEDVISDCLRFCFDRSSYFAENFLMHICDLDINEYINVEMLTRKMFPSSGVPDILVVAETEEYSDLVIIENKLKAEEGYEQTERYSSKELPMAINDRFGHGKSLRKVNMIFLSLFPNQKPMSKLFIHKTYDIFVKQLDINLMKENQSAHLLMSCWLDLLNKFYNKNEVDSKDLLVKKLVDNDKLDGSFLYFMKLFSAAPLVDDMYCASFFRGSERGRKYYGVLFEKEHWHSDQMVETGTKGLFDFLDDVNYNIHIEPQFNVLNCNLTIPLHYELNWYEPESSARKCVVPAALDNYLTRRQAFIDLLSAFNIKSFTFGGGWNQVGKLVINIDDSMTVGDFWNIFYNETAMISDSIDRIILELNKAK